MPVAPGALAPSAETQVRLPDLAAGPTFVISVEIEDSSEQGRAPPISAVRLLVESASGKVCLMDATGCKESARLVSVEESWSAAEAPFELVLGQEGPDRPRSFASSTAIRLSSRSPGVRSASD